MRLKIRGTRNYVINLSSDATLENLKAKLAKVEQSEDIALYVAGKPVDFECEDSTVAQFKNYTVDVVVRLKGGKVHGSLNQTGKVKGLTPYVEQTEKKKKKTGRAGKREKYNKRFLCVTSQTEGKRRGPNSNR